MNCAGPPKFLSPEIHDRCRPLRPAGGDPRPRPFADPSRIRSRRRAFSSRNGCLYQPRRDSEGDPPPHRRCRCLVPPAALGRRPRNSVEQSPRAALSDSRRRAVRFSAALNRRLPRVRSCLQRSHVAPLRTGRADRRSCSRYSHRLRRRGHASLDRCAAPRHCLLRRHRIALRNFSVFRRRSVSRSETLRDRIFRRHRAASGHHGARALFLRLSCSRTVSRHGGGAAGFLSVLEKIARGRRRIRSHCDCAFRHAQRHPRRNCRFPAVRLAHLRR